MYKLAMTLCLTFRVNKIRFWLLSPIDAKMPPLNIHTAVSRKARGLNFGMSLHLHPFFVNVSSQGSGKPVQ